MNVRDAVEDDADALAALADLPPDAMRTVIHDRTVRVGELPSAEDGDEGGAESEAPEPRGFVSFDVRDNVVHVTQFGGPRDACERLLEEPVRFAENEGMDVEVVVTANDESMRAAVEAVGFEKKGSGPMFEGQRTVRYRLTP
ncbi:hypothetical protein SAMN04487948_103461 [Halogranum amylolyticum]|uniref:N-acetyltransferase domain-containing protein n=1 Tax=Halogranum amylolyticum TaxID=660520 RepID=A0A1H8R326_9EURY|nr:hypothetical protein [Halogranum amylolyticum]SEO60697.1 hypothetical protein SAMN04487948_103461 [Halogranum amylolyticum]